MVVGFSYTTPMEWRSLLEFMTIFKWVLACKGVLLILKAFRLRLNLSQRILMNSVGGRKKLVNDSDICKPGVRGVDLGFMLRVIIFLPEVLSCSSYPEFLSPCR